MRSSEKQTDHFLGFKKLGEQMFLQNVCDSLVLSCALCCKNLEPLTGPYDSFSILLDNVFKIAELLHFARADKMKFILWLEQIVSVFSEKQMI